MGSIARMRPQLHRHCGRVRGSPPLEARTAASTFKHQLDAIEVEDAQALRRPAQNPLPLPPSILPQETHFLGTSNLLVGNQKNLLFLLLFTYFNLFPRMGLLHGAAFHNPTSTPIELSSATDSPSLSGGRPHARTSSPSSHKWPCCGSSSQTLAVVDGMVDKLSFNNRY